MSTVNRNEPRISINALGRYLTATAAGRRRILIEQKNPPAYKVGYYSDAEGPISDFLIGRIGEDALIACRNELLKKPTAKAYDKQRNRSCAQAIQRFIEFANDLDLGGLQLRKGRRDSPKLLCAGVSISVRPEIVIVRPSTGNGRPPVYGLIKLYFGKDKALRDAGGACIASVLFQYAEGNAPSNTPCDRDLCQVIDVFAGEVFTTPKAVKRHRRDVEAACQEIAGRWEQV